MERPNLLNREQLLELAALDAFDLLEPVEVELFDQSFHHAPEAVQREIRDLQATLVSDETLLAAGEPRRALRQRVLRAVAETVEQDGERFAPIATIGRGASPHTGRRRLSPSGQFWRAAAFALMGSLLVVAYFLLDALQHNAEITRIALNSHTDEELERLIGPTVNAFMFGPGTQMLPLADLNADNDDETTLAATILYREDGSQSDAFLVLRGFPRNSDQAYRIEVKTPEGDLAFQRDFQSNGRVSGVQLGTIAVASLSTCTISILDASGAVLAKFA